MSTEHIKKLKEHVHSLYLNNPYGATQVAFGCKQTKGIYSDEKCICFGVEEKLPIEQISSDKIIPASMSIDGVVYKTDVFKTFGTPKILALFKHESEVQSINQNLNPTPIYINNVPVLGTDAEKQSYSSDVNWPKCQMWLYSNTSATPVTMSWIFCRDYPITSSVGNMFTDPYVYLATPINYPTPDGPPYTPPDFPGLTKTGGTSGFPFDFYDCCSETGTYGAVSSRLTPNRSKRRPLLGGISMMAPPPAGYLSTGTLGGIVVDSTDGKMVGLTNNHVCANPGGSVQDCKFLAGDTYGSTDSNYRTINIYQPGSLDSGNVNYVGWLTNNSSDFIGTTKRAFPLTSTGTNYIDAGIVNLSDSIVNTNSWSAISASFVSPPPFATTAEIDALTTSNEIFKSGRTTGAIRYDFINEYSSAYPCNIRVTQTSTSVGVTGYVGATPDFAISFADLIRLESPWPDNTIPGLGGDSGSLVYAKIGGVWKVIGLFFAGNGVNAGWACRIDRVVELLKIQAYTGGTVNANPNTPTHITVDYNTYKNEVSASIGGKIYWQVGKNF
jgi:hypothetical protein